MKQRGVPDEAFETLPEDDKDSARAAKRNKNKREDTQADQSPISGRRKSN